MLKKSLLLVLKINSSHAHPIPLNPVEYQQGEASTNMFTQCISVAVSLPHTFWPYDIDVTSQFHVTFASRNSYETSKTVSDA